MNYNPIIPSKTIFRKFLRRFKDDRFLNEIVLLIDFEGNILTATRKFYIIDFFGDFTLKKINVFDVIDKSFHNKIVKRIEMIRLGKVLPPAEYKLVNKNNRTTHVKVHSKPVTFSRKNMILTLVQDISMNVEIEKHRLASVIEAEEIVREQFARDFHDEIGPFLSALKLYLVELKSSDREDRKKEIMDSLYRMIQETIDRMRAISRNQISSQTRDNGLFCLVRKYIDQINNTGRLKILYKTQGTDEKIEQNLVVTIYRIILELINNCIRHSGSAVASIAICTDNETITILYRDKGKGFDLEEMLAKENGIGLKSILNRTELFEGNYHFKKNDRCGVEFRIHFPLR